MNLRPERRYGIHDGDTELTAGSTVRRDKHSGELLIGLYDGRTIHAPHATMTDRMRDRDYPYNWSIDLGPGWTYVDPEDRWDQR